MSDEGDEPNVKIPLSVAKELDDKFREAARLAAEHKKEELTEVEYEEWLDTVYSDWTTTRIQLEVGIDEETEPREMTDDEKAWLEAAPHMAAEAMAAANEQDREEYAEALEDDEE